MAYPTILDPALDELRQAYRDGDLVLFAGAGVSAAAGLPSWARLVKMLADRARARGATATVLDEIDALADSGRFIDALSAAKTAVGVGDFGAVVEAALDDRRVLTVPEIGQAIAALGAGLRAVLTTNIDHLLERAFAGVWPMLSHATPDIARRRQFILKLHGTLIDRKTWVFTRDEYDRATYADPLLKDAFSAIFLACPILFVGYGLSDDDFDQVLGRVRALAGGQMTRHFALVADESITPHWRKLREDAGVRVIGYPNVGHTHAEVPRILRWLAELEDATPAAPPNVDAGVATFRAAPAAPTGALPPQPDAPYDPSFYVHRVEEEERALDRLASPGTPVVLWGPWLSGKSTLLRHLLDRVQQEDRAAGKQSLVLEVNLLDVLPKPATADGLLEAFARAFCKEARVADDIFEKLAKGRQGWSDKLIELMEDHILPAAQGRVVLVVEKADAVWGLHDVQGSFYGALRRCKERANRPAWSSFRFILLLSTTPSLVFEDPQHIDSPLANLTEVIELLDLVPAEIVELARMHGLDWDRATVDRHVYSLVGGHPYLNRALMYRARRRGEAVHMLVNDAEALERLYGHHLGELGRLVERDPRLREALEAVLDNPRAALDEDRYQRLRRGGLVIAATGGEHRIRYRLYESYLRRRWNRPAR